MPTRICIYVIDVPEKLWQEIFRMIVSNKDTPLRPILFITESQRELFKAWREERWGGRDKNKLLLDKARFILHPNELGRDPVLSGFIFPTAESIDVAEPKFLQGYGRIEPKLLPEAKIFVVAPKSWRGLCITDKLQLGNNLLSFCYGTKDYPYVATAANAIAQQF
jgi:hypothetical protein